LEHVKRDLVLANRILARENVIDDFGHVSIRNPDDPNRYFLSRSRSPELVTLDDIMEFTLAGDAIDQRGRAVYAERAIHGAVFIARPEVNAITHFHARSVIPFTVADEPLKPLFHMAAVIGEEVRVWDSQPEFGDTDMRVTTQAMGRSLANMLGQDRVVLMRGHGAVAVGENIRTVLMTSIYLKENAELILQARSLGKPLYYLTAGEIQKTGTMLREPLSSDRAWDYYVSRAGFRGM
jgi:HCOMODA/2-hydroxy-3-carboxy-muconic semialdehyde decarboxylase